MRLRRVSRFHGRFALAGDKSISHRLALLGALAHGRTKIGNFSAAADCQSTLDCLAQVGVAVTRDGTEVTIDGRGPESWYAPSAPLDAGNSGSTLRMLAGPLAGRPFRATLSGDASLNRRPMERVAVPLRAMGARIQTTDGRPPMTIEGGSLSGIEWRLPVASAQVKTAVLLAGLQADGTTTVHEPQASRDHTERLLPAFGVDVRTDGGALSVRRQDLRAFSMDVPGDVSSAAFLLVAALVLPDAHVRVEHVLLNPRRTAFLDVLRAMGGDLTVGVDSEAPEPVGWIEARSSRLHGITVDPAVVPALIDEVPALAVAAALAEGTFTVSGAAELRVKESDRIAALADGLGKMGAAVEERSDGLVIEGGRPLHGASVASHDDHRIAMALAVAALSAEGETEIEGGACVAVSFPDFLEAPGARQPVSRPARVVLVGFMGAGKSTVGPEVARALGFGFTDLDRALERRLGVTVPELFRTRGEAAFRAEELAEARSAAGLARHVIAAGGGAFAQDETRDVLRSGAFSVWLRCGLPTVLARVPPDGSRPLALDRATIQELFVQRESSYRQADRVVDAEQAPASVARDVVLAYLTLPGELG